MTPLLYLHEECENVSRTLKETLRHDYGPSDAKAYYKECTDRLAALQLTVSQINEADDPRIPDQLAILAGIANRVSLIERSHLGEFSWPFAAAIRDIANKLLVERDLRGDLTPPVVHMVAEGTGYHIRIEQKPDPHMKRKIAIVAFPRQLKHHAMMHTIFGHELGHAAFYTNVAGQLCKSKVIPEIRKAGPLQNKESIEAWMRAEGAPVAVKEKIAATQDLRISESQIEHWTLELMCDLFGLLMFGPAFVAAHRTLLQPASRSPDDVEFKNSTHPPLAVRRHMLVNALRILGWHRPTIDEHSDARKAEEEMLRYLMEDTDDPWPNVFTDEQLTNVLDSLALVFEGHPELRASPPEGSVTKALVDRISLRLPPILERLDEEGRATQDQVRMCDCLYAGWTYWLGRRHLSGGEKPLNFLQTNRLCDHALLQQRAIDLVTEKRKSS